MRTALLLFSLLNLCTAPLLANPSRPGDSAEMAGESWDFKLTPSVYRTTKQLDAYDLNLRGNQGAHALWLGYYNRGSEFSQSRTGYEYSWSSGPLKLVPSLQAATHGFVGGSLNAEIGGPVYALLGLGRTNLKDYYNLNFDPNDSAVYGLGTRLLPQSQLSYFSVRDNRLATGQQVQHLVWRYQADSRHRWTLDLASKRGRPTPDDDPVHGRSLSLAYDVDRLFIHLARDSKVNFSPNTMTRLSIGLRF